MASEFDLIARYFTRATRHTSLGVGDDAALITLSPAMELAISADMLVAGTHFFHDADAYQLGWKSLAVNVSDMAAMGANPRWATLAIALPGIIPSPSQGEGQDGGRAFTPTPPLPLEVGGSVTGTWLAEFSRGFFACADAFEVDLIGGDTTRGPLTISVQIMGEVPAGQAIKRNGAKVGDEVWVSGSLGDAALGLAHLQGEISLEGDALRASIHALHRPAPRVALGLALRGVANSAIDVSDGLLADLGHILECSKAGATLQAKQIPHAKHAEALRLALSGGDDYELCFTAPIDRHAEILQISEQLVLPLSCIGQITQGAGVIVQDEDGEILEIKKTGFDHFG